MNKKGQVAFEFLLIYSFFIFVFLSSIYIITGQSIKQQKYAEGLYAREFIIRIADEINSAAMIDGYQKNVTIPTTINGADYQLYIYKGMIGLNYSAFSQIDLLYPLGTDNIVVNREDTRTGQRYINTKKGRFQIFNHNGQVILYD